MNDEISPGWLDVFPERFQFNCKQFNKYKITFVFNGGKKMRKYNQPHSKYKLNGKKH